MAREARGVAYRAAKRQGCPVPMRVLAWRSIQYARLDFALRRCRAAGKIQHQVPFRFATCFLQHLASAVQQCIVQAQIHTAPLDRI